MKLIFALVSLAFVALAKANQLPSFDFATLMKDIREGNIEQIEQVGKDIGAFALSGIPGADGYHQSLRVLQDAAVECLVKDSNVAKTILNDNSERFTSARAAGDANAHPECVQTDKVEAMFNVAQDIVNLVIRVLNNDVSPIFHVGGEERTLFEAGHLDHLHLYKQAKKQKRVPFSAPYHVDNGMFLLLTPNAEQPLLVQDRHGNQLVADAGDVVVVFGRGLSQWLFQTSPKTRLNFRAAPHAVPAITKDRVVFARMIVAPANALPPFKDEKTIKSFGDVFKNQHPDFAECSGTDLFWQAQQQNCAAGEQHCWMGCLPIDNGCNADVQVCLNQNNESCCVEGQSSIADGCLDMDVTCQWQCPTA